MKLFMKILQTARQFFHEMQGGDVIEYKHKADSIDDLTRNVIQTYTVAQQSKLQIPQSLLTYFMLLISFDTPREHGVLNGLTGIIQSKVQGYLEISQFFCIAF